MLNQDQGHVQVEGINCYDVVVITQLIEKGLRQGIITGRELGHVAALRVKLLQSVHQAIGVDLDNPIQEAAIMEKSDVE